MAGQSSRERPGLELICGKLLEEEVPTCGGNIRCHSKVSRRQPRQEIFLGLLVSGMFGVNLRFNMDTASGCQIKKELASVCDRSGKERVRRLQTALQSSSVLAHSIVFCFIFFRFDNTQVRLATVSFVWRLSYLSVTAAGLLSLCPE